MRHLTWNENYNTVRVWEVPYGIKTSNCTNISGQSSTAVSRPQGNVQDVGSNPACARNENQTLGDPPPPPPPPTEGGPMVWTGSQWKTGDVKPS